MDTTQCIQTRRSIRKYKPDPIDHTLLESIISTASYSPSCSASYSASYLTSCFSPYFAVRCQIKKNTAPSAHIPAPQNIAAGRAAWAAAPNSRLVAIPVPSDKTA